MEPPNHYELLGVAPEASAAEIREKYRRLVRIYHPDVAGAAGAAMTLRLNEAQTVLLDPALRARADAGLTVTPPAPPRRPTPAPEFRRAAPRPAPASEPMSSVAWDILAICSFIAIAVATINAFVFAYSGQLGTLSPRLIPPVILALVWIVGCFPGAPRILYLIVGFCVLLWPFAIADQSLFGAMTEVVPVSVWTLVSIASASAFVLRLSAPRASALGVLNVRFGR